MRTLFYKTKGNATFWSHEKNVQVQVNKLPSDVKKFEVNPDREYLCREPLVPDLNTHNLFSKYIFLSNI